MKGYLTIFLKGAWIGGTLTVPGVSGGSMAMILGVYERLIYSFNSLIKRKNRADSALFLILFCSGSLLGFLTLSHLVVYLLEHYAVPMILFFAGGVIGGLPIVLDEIRDQRIYWYHWGFFLAGAAVIILLALLPDGYLILDPEKEGSNIFMQAIGGFIAAIALILPGISVSHMLYVLGVYEGVMQAAAELNFVPLIPFIAGGIIGTVLMARFIEWLLHRYKLQTYLAVMGFVVGSVVELLSRVRISELSIWCVPLFLSGFFGVFLMYYKGKTNA